MTRYLGDKAPIPALDDFNHEWFTRGVITIQRCEDCRVFQHPADEMCGACQSFNLGWHECSGDGRIESIAVVHQAVHPGFKDAVPYNIVVVSLADVPSVSAIGNVVNRNSDEIEIGQTVRVIFEDVPATDKHERLLIPNWEVV
jgi:uncharacterized OB-fold protein